MIPTTNKISNFTLYEVTVTCPKCGVGQTYKALNPQITPVTTCICGYTLNLMELIGESTYKQKESKKQAEERLKSTMLFNLVIRFMESSNGKTIFRGQALTYEQCDSQIGKVRQYIKEQFVNSVGDKKLYIEMSPIEWVKLPTE